MSSDLRELDQMLSRHISEAGRLDLAHELIPAGQPAAENPLDPDQPHSHEDGIALFVAEKLKALSAEVELFAKPPGRPNVVGTFYGEPDAPTLIINDHLDT